MKIFNLFILSVSLFFMVGCDSDDNIVNRLSELGLGQHELKVSHDKYSTVIPTKNAGWSIMGGTVTINGESVNFKNEFYLHSDETHQDVQLYKDTVIGDWFKIIKKSEKELEINLSENDSENDRMLTVFVEGPFLSPEKLEIYQDKK